LTRIASSAFCSCSSLESNTMLAVYQFQLHQTLSNQISYWIHRTRN
jgi:hypothetical protein